MQAMVGKQAEVQRECNRAQEGAGLLQSVLVHIGHLERELAEAKAPKQAQLDQGLHHVHANPLTQVRSSSPSNT